MWLFFLYTFFSFFFLDFGSHDRNLCEHLSEYCTKGQELLGSEKNENKFFQNGEQRAIEVISAGGLS